MIYYSKGSFKEQYGKKLELISPEELFDKISLGISFDFIHLIGMLRGIAKVDPYHLDYRKLKHELPFFYGTCLREYHSKDCFPVYNGNLHIDLDFKSDISDIGINLLMKSLKNDPYVYLGFISPSGRGIKLFVKTNNKNPNSYYLAIRQFSKYLETNHGINSKYVDTNVSIKHICFMSYDPTSIFNRDPKKFEVEIDTVTKGNYMPRPRSTSYYSSSISL